MVISFGLQKPSLPNSTSTPKPLDCGKRRVVLKLLKPKEGTEGISTTITNNLLPQNEILSMQGFHPTSKNWTLKDKLLFCKKNIQTLKLSKTLDQDSISKGEDSLPFWNQSLKPMYNKLWLPTKTDCVDLDSIFSKNCSHVKGSPLLSYQMNISKSLLENSQRTSCQSLRFSQPDIMAPESIQYCQKLRIYPNKKQVVLFNQCLGASRFFYNKSVALIQEKLKHNDYSILNRQKLRPLVMQSDKELIETDSMSWQKHVPYDTRQEAIADAVTAFKSAFTNLKNGNIKYFDISFKSKKIETSQSFKINCDAFNSDDISIFKKRLDKNSKIRMRKKALGQFKKVGQVDQFFTILKTRPGKWYLCLPRIKEQPRFSNPVYKSVFLDPGVRTFLTFYSPDGVCGKIENGNVQSELKIIAEKHDKLQGIADKCKISKTKRHLKSHCAKLRHKMKCKIDNLHWQTCSLLCKTFQNIFLPSFEVSNMVKDSPLGSSITRKMLQLSHGKFRERLKWYGPTRNRNIYIVNEHYTTKTCGSCGTINPDVGSNSTFKCQSCDHTIDRDIGAARNICLRFVSKFI